MSDSVKFRGSGTAILSSCTKALEYNLFYAKMKHKLDSTNCLSCACSEYSMLILLLNIPQLNPNISHFFYSLSLCNDPFIGRNLPTPAPDSLNCCDLNGDKNWKLLKY